MILKNWIRSKWTPDVKPLQHNWVEWRLYATSEFNTLELFTFTIATKKSPRDKIEKI